MSNSFVGSLLREELDEIHHVIELVLLGLYPYYPLCCEIDVSMTLLCLILVTRILLLGVSNSFVGSLVSEELDEIHHVIKLVLLGLDP